MKQTVFGIILEQREEEQKAGRNVATSQRHDVRSTRRGSQQVTNVATPQRRDVATSRSQCDFCLNIIKSKGTRNRGGIGKCTDEGTKSIVGATHISGEETCFCIFFFSEKLLMVYRLITCIIKSSMF